MEPATPISRTTADTNQSAPTTHTDHNALRLIPPIAALGASFVLQVIAVTDLLGGALSEQLHTNWAYLLGALFGCAVAASAEGGAAYLLDLYDKHLLAGDSTWMLRLAMIVYVAISAAAIHWWCQNRNIPGVLPWLLAAMSASALFLWSRGSRWKNREQMRRKGQLDTALPRLATAAKIMHPIRWITTLWLISWEQVETTEQARTTYAKWKQCKQHPGSSSPITAQAQWDNQITQPASQALPQARKQRPTPTRPAITAGEQCHEPADQLPLSGELIDDEPATEQVSTQTRTRRISVTTEEITEQVSTQKASIEQLAAVLDQQSPGRIPGRPTALRELRAAFGSCSDKRAEAAIALLRQMRTESVRNG